MHRISEIHTGRERDNIRLFAFNGGRHSFIVGHGNFSLYPYPDHTPAVGPSQVLF